MTVKWVKGFILVTFLYRLLTIQRNVVSITRVLYLRMNTGLV